VARTFLTEVQMKKCIKLGDAVKLARHESWSFYVVRLRSRNLGYLNWGCRATIWVLYRVILSLSERPDASYKGRGSMERPINSWLAMVVWLDFLKQRKSWDCAVLIQKKRLRKIQDSFYYF